MLTLLELKLTTQKNLLSKIWGLLFSQFAFWVLIFYSIFSKDRAFPNLLTLQGLITKPILEVTASMLSAI